MPIGYIQTETSISLKYIRLYIHLTLKPLYVTRKPVPLTSLDATFLPLCCLYMFIDYVTIGQPLSKGQESRGEELV